MVVARENRFGPHSIEKASAILTVLAHRLFGGCLRMPVLRIANTFIGRITTEGTACG
jgi:hypothetical protein